MSLRKRCSKDEAPYLKDGAPNPLYWLDVATLRALLA
jgi:hypothetical protein